MYTWNRKRKEEVYMIGETCPPSIPPSSYKQAPVEEIFEKGGGVQFWNSTSQLFTFWGKCVIFPFYYTIRQFLGVNSSQDLDKICTQANTQSIMHKKYVCVHCFGIFIVRARELLFQKISFPVIGIFLLLEMDTWLEEKRIILAQDWSSQYH